MPKRRTSPAQKAASRRNGKKHKGTPRGKLVTLTHHTSVKAADSIVSQQKFKPNVATDPLVFFTKKGDKDFGPAAVRVSVPASAIRKDWNNEPGAVQVNKKHLEGRKIRKGLT